MVVTLARQNLANSLRSRSDLQLRLASVLLPHPIIDLHYRLNGLLKGLSFFRMISRVSKEQPSTTSRTGWNGGTNLFLRSRSPAMLWRKCGKFPPCLRHVSSPYRWVFLPPSAPYLRCLFLKPLHPRSRHEVLCAGDVTSLELRGLCHNGPRRPPGKAGSRKEEPCRCLCRSGRGCRAFS